MEFNHVLSIFVVLYVSTISFGQRVGYPLTSRERNLILQLHNEARSNVSPTATYMRRLVSMPCRYDDHVINNIIKNFSPLHIIYI